MFLNALKMITVPLILSSIIVGMAGMSSGTDLGRLGGRTMALFLATSATAIVAGLVAMLVVTPGYMDGIPAGEALALQPPVTATNTLAAGSDRGAIAGVFLRVVPENIVMAAANGDMLGLIFFALLFGYFMTRIGDELAAPMLVFWNGLFQVMMHLTQWVMKLAPIGVFALVAAVAAEAGFRAAGTLILFTITVLIALLVHAAVILPLFVRCVGRISPFGIFSAMAPALLTAFSTASSSATLPVTMDCVERNAGVSNRISSFVLPLGATINMNGSALYVCAAVIFIAQAYGMELTVGAQLTVCLLALLTSIGAAGVPAASLIAISVMLTAIGLPVDAIGILLVFDRVLDMVRTSVNIFGDACVAVIIAELDRRIEGKESPCR